MKLFDEKEHYTLDGLIMSGEFEKAINDIFKKYIGDFPIRQIGYIAVEAAHTIALEQILLKENK